MPSNSLLDFITKIIKFEGFRATNYHFITENELLIQLENKSGGATCPHCHKITDKVHQSHPYRVRDIPLSTWDVFLLVDRRQFKGDEALWKMVEWTESSYKYFPKSCQTIKRWIDEILAYFDNRTTQGAVEGINQKIKLIKRRAYGLNNFDNFRRIVLLNWHFC